MVAERVRICDRRGTTSDQRLLDRACAPHPVAPTAIAAARSVTTNFNPTEDPMLIGQSVLAPTGGAIYYSPWFPRQGNAFRVVIEVLRASSEANVALSCVVQTKNNENADSSASTLTTFSPTITANTVSSASVEGCLELVRYQFTVTGTTSTRWLHFRSDPPIWLPN
jgi:hypothetical protein